MGGGEQRGGGTSISSRAPATRIPHRSRRNVRPRRPASILPRRCPGVRRSFGFRRRPTHPSVGTSSRIPLSPLLYTSARRRPVAPGPRPRGWGLGGRSYCYRRVTLGPPTLNHEEKHQQFKKPQYLLTISAPPDTFCLFRLRRTENPISRHCDPRHIPTIYHLVLVGSCFVSSVLHVRILWFP